MDLGAWLRGLGLGRYLQAFRDHDIDATLLPTLSAADLKELGVASLGHRKRLLEAIAGLSGAGAAAERRQLTVLFSDLVGSTALAARLDPEDMRDVVRACHEATAAVVGRYEGHVAKLLGDGMLACFGWPRAHEDDAERAVRAGLDVVAAIRTLEPQGLHLQMRVGIATGLVIAGDMLGEGVSEAGAISGEAPNLAARLQALAEPGAVVISEATHRLAGGLFECRDLGARDLKGFRTPTRVWAALRPRAAASRFDLLRAPAMSDLVGRDAEARLLLRRWHRATAGAGQLVLISGEPGIGKSRLVRALRERIEGEACTPVQLQCSPFHTNSALHPVIEQLERAAEIAPADGTDARLDKLEALLAGSDAEEMFLLAALLSLPTARYPPLELSPQQLKQRTLDVLCRRLIALGSERPLLLVVEDAHWIDPTTLELTELIAARLQDAPILALVTCRPEFDAFWPGITRLALSRLDRHAAELMIEKVPGGADLPAELRARIVERADGVPLFVEELTRSIVETDPAAAIPTTLRDSLTARLDRLGRAREVAQVGAALGRSFAYRMIRRTMPLAEPELHTALERLTRSGLVQQRGEPPGALYVFKHALVQDAAYDSLLRRERERVHVRIAEAFEEEHPQAGATQPELLAHHYTAARRPEPALRYWTEAAQLAFNRSAVKEAIGHAQNGLEVVASLAEARPQAAARLLALLALALKASKGIGHPDTEQAFERAHALARQCADPTLVFQALYGLWHAHWFQGHLKRAGQEARDLLAQATAGDSREQRLAADSAVGFSLVHSGENAEGLMHLERMHALYDPQTDARLPFKYMVEFGVIHGFCSAIASFALGFPDEALRRARAGIARGRARQPINLCAALNFGGHVPLARGEPALALEWADEALALSQANGFEFISPFALINRGSARAQLGAVADGLAEIRVGIAAWRAAGSGLWLARHLILLAEASLLDRQAAAAIGIADDALAAIACGGERHFLAPALVTRGDALLRADGAQPAAAEACYREALDVARSQSAKAWELRAATRLARLWHAQGRAGAAHELLAPVQGWFKEGHGTRDLRAAQALLDALRADRPLADGDAAT